MGLRGGVVAVFVAAGGGIAAMLVALDADSLAERLGGARGAAATAILNPETPVVEIVDTLVLFFFDRVLSLNVLFCFANRVEALLVEASDEGFCLSIVVGMEN